MTLTDGVIVLRSLDVSDVATHFAGEDEELVRWLNGGPGTRVTVEAHIRACMAAWRTGGPTFNFGIRAGAPERLIGTVDGGRSQANDGGPTRGRAGPSSWALVCGSGR